MSAIRIENLTHSYGTRRALDGVNFSVEPGRICGILGPNGSGKSTLFRILTTLIPVQSGSARILDADVGTQPVLVRQRIGVVFQSPSLDRQLTVRENLLHQGHLYGLRGRGLQSRIDELLDLVQMRDRDGEYTARLSGGQKRRVELAKGLLHRPGVLLLDEPSTGLDPAARRAFSDQLAELRRRDGLTALLTTHIMEEADRCDRLIILDEGRVVESGTPDELKRQIAGDCVIVHARNLDALAGRIAEQLGVQPRRVDQSLRIETPRGSEMISRLAETFGSDIDSMTLARPTLEDVFIHHTGHGFHIERGANAA